MTRFRNSQKVLKDRNTKRRKAWEYINLFIEEYVPVFFLLGWMTRRCFWEGRAPGTGHWARETLELCLLVLRTLEEPTGKVSEYSRSIAAALLSWTSWHDGLPACVFVEESCEANLSRLHTACQRNSWAMTAEQVCDLYINIGPPQTESKSASQQMVSRSLQQQVNEHLAALRTGPYTQVTWCPWKAEKHCIAQESWPARVPSVRPLGAIDTDSVRHLLHRSLRTLIIPRDQSQTLTQALTAFAPPRPSHDIRAQRTAMETIKAWALPTRARRASSAVVHAPATVPHPSAPRVARPQAPQTVLRPPLAHYEEGPPEQLHPVPARHREHEPLSPRLVGIGEDSD